MFLTCHLLLFLHFLLVTAALPVSDSNVFLTVNPKAALCQLRFIGPRLCYRGSSSGVQVQTALGVAPGVRGPFGVVRFTVKYANAERWAPSTVASTWSSPTGSVGPTSLPLACPQLGISPTAYAEDCLSMILYVPSNLKPNAATLMWIHGGSFIEGSATGPGLDGSGLATATNSIVAVIQYRLGALGLLAPNGNTNLLVGDIINALKFLRETIPSFGGSSSKITIAGQSSGATMIRSLLAAPSAAPLFKSAILQSDPMNYGFLSIATQKILQDKFNSLVNCTGNPADALCRNSLPLDAILLAQSTIVQTAVSLDPSTGNGEPIRPVLDHALIASPLDSTAPFPSVSKNILISSVRNEAGYTTYNIFPDVVSRQSFPIILNSILGKSRTEAIIHSQFYAPNSDGSAQADARTELQALATDYIWKCSSWTFARNWVANGGRAWVGEYQVGASYPGNGAVQYCTTPGVVCHQDDIMIVFGTVTNPTAAQAALVKQMQAHYKAFLYNGNPSAPGLPMWTASTSSDVHPLKLGGSGEVAAGPCVPSFWGVNVQYDYQLYNI